MQNNTSFGPGAGATAPSQGPTIGAIIVVIVLILGAAYFIWQKGQEMADSTTPPETNLPATSSGQTSPLTDDSLDDSTINQLQNQGTSDELQAIETDLAATDLENLDAGLNELEQELNQP